MLKLTIPKSQPLGFTWGDDFTAGEIHFLIPITRDNGFSTAGIPLNYLKQGPRLSYTKFRSVDHFKVLQDINLVIPGEIFSDEYSVKLTEIGSNLTRIRIEQGDWYDEKDFLMPGRTYSCAYFSTNYGRYYDYTCTNNGTSFTVKYKWCDPWVSSTRYGYFLEQTCKFDAHGNGTIRNHFREFADYGQTITRDYWRDSSSSKYFYENIEVKYPEVTNAQLKQVLQIYRGILFGENADYRKNPILFDPIPVSESEYYFACKDSLRQLDCIGINWYENAAMLQEGLKYIPNATKKLIGSLSAAVDAGATRDIRKLTKEVSSLFLSKKYGIDNDVRDFKALAGFRTLWDLIQRSEITLHGSYEGIHATLICSPFYSGTVWTDVLGITPSASNLWAVVPFSFCVDWAFKCGHNLREIELSKMWAENEYNIHSVCLSYKHRYDVQVEECTIDGIKLPKWNAQVSHYHREARRYAPDFVYETPDYFKGMEDHIIEAGALIFSQI